MQYDRPAAIPGAYAAAIGSEVAANLKTARAERSQRLAVSSPATQDGLLTAAAAATASTVWTAWPAMWLALASMIQLHINLKQWVNVDYARASPRRSFGKRLRRITQCLPHIAAECRKIEAVDYMRRSNNAVLPPQCRKIRN